MGFSSNLMGIAGLSMYPPCNLLWRMQIISLDLALANGTMLTITPQSQPHLWKAAQVARPCTLFRHSSQSAAGVFFQGQC